jgi:hypothetical protein
MAKAFGVIHEPLPVRCPARWKINPPESHRGGQDVV